MTRRSSLYATTAMIVLAIAVADQVLAEELPDIRGVPTDLVTPRMEESSPDPGKRVRQTLDAYRGTNVFHTLYLPADWKPNQRYPVLVEYAGNGPYKNAFGDTCSGKVEDCNLGFGISGGREFIWLCLPYISPDHSANQLQWWGDLEATVDYCKRAVSHVCQRYGGNPDEVFLTGFSRGSIACNYIGLHDDEIAGLWLGFICHSHYDGVRNWNYEGSDRQSAATRLTRLMGRPQFISHEQSIDETRSYLAKAYPEGKFHFQPLPFRNHTDAWVLRNIPERHELRNWVQTVLRDARNQHSNR